MMKQKESQPFVTWCALIWDMWREKADNETFKELYYFIGNLVIENFSGISRDWLKLIAYAQYRYFGEPSFRGKGKSTIRE